MSLICGCAGGNLLKKIYLEISKNKKQFFLNKSTCVTIFLCEYQWNYFTHQGKERNRKVWIFCQEGRHYDWFMLPISIGSCTRCFQQESVNEREIQTLRENLTLNKILFLTPAEDFLSCAVSKLIKVFIIFSNCEEIHPSRLDQASNFEYFNKNSYCMTNKPIVFKK